MASWSAVNRTSPPSRATARSCGSRCAGKTASRSWTWKLAGAKAPGSGTPAQRRSFKTINGPAQVWFSKDGSLAFIVSQKVPLLDVFATNFDARGRSRPERLVTVDIKAQDPRAFTPFLKTSPDGAEVWLSHKIADAVSAWTTTRSPRVLDTVDLGQNARPNHVEFVENARGKFVYVSLARVDDGGPGGAASSRIAIIDRSASAGSRKVVGQFFSQGREAHGLWTNPEGTRLYIAHEQDELPNTANAGQTVCSVFDVSEPCKAAIHYADTAGRSCRCPRAGSATRRASISSMCARARAVRQGEGMLLSHARRAVIALVLLSACRPRWRNRFAVPPGAGWPCPSISRCVVAG